MSQTASLSHDPESASSYIENFKARLARIASHYDARAERPSKASLSYRKALAHYLRLIIPRDASILEIGCADGAMLELLGNRQVAGIDLSPKQIEKACRNLPDGQFAVEAAETFRSDGKFDYVLIHDTLHTCVDVQAAMENARSAATAKTRLVVTYYNLLWRPVLALCDFLGLRKEPPAANWLAPSDVRNLATLSGWSLVREEARLLVPVEIPLVGTFINRLLAPLLSPLCLAHIAVFRLTDAAKRRAEKVSVVVPARNEAGNIQNALDRLPRLAPHTELIFVEGNSTDDTWDAIQALQTTRPDITLLKLRQTGRGKGDAVRAGFQAATGDILMILDADLTVSPEELPKFVAALESGVAEYANGVRLVYPMDKRAMRFFNLCANKFFAIAFSWLLGQDIKDTLCGTKVLWREDYLRIAANRSYFGDFDPFGDFDIIFGATKANLRMVDVPIRYRERIYGTTNIQRWRHGAILLRMLLLAAARLKFV